MLLLRQSDVKKIKRGRLDKSKDLSLLRNLRSLDVGGRFDINLDNVDMGCLPQDRVDKFKKKYGPVIREFIMPDTLRKKEDNGGSGE